MISILVCAALFVERAEFKRPRLYKNAFRRLGRVKAARSRVERAAQRVGGR